MTILPPIVCGKLNINNINLCNFAYIILFTINTDSREKMYIFILSTTTYIGCIEVLMVVYIKSLVGRFVKICMSIDVIVWVTVYMLRYNLKYVNC